LAGRQDDPDNYKSVVDLGSTLKMLWENKARRGEGVEYKCVHGWGTRLSQTIPNSGHPWTSEVGGDETRTLWVRKETPEDRVNEPDGKWEGKGVKSGRKRNKKNYKKDYKGYRRQEQRKRFLYSHVYLI
jgi:hypothetical protein